MKDDGSPRLLGLDAGFEVPLFGLAPKKLKLFPTKLQSVHIHEHVHT